MKSGGGGVFRSIVPATLSAVDLNREAQLKVSQMLKLKP